MTGDLLTSLANCLANQEKFLAPAKMPGGEVLRFLTEWGNAVAALSFAQRPRSVLFTLAPPSVVGLPLEPARVSQLVTDIVSAQGTNQIVHATFDGAVSSRSQIPPGLLAIVRAGQWNEGQASRASSEAFANSCVILATGVRVRVYVNGVEVYGFEDARDKTTEIAAGAVQTQGWVDGELLSRCGRECLIDRGRLGIWRLPDSFVLHSKPELLMEERLDWFLKANLRGYIELIREMHYEKDGRLDIFIVMWDGRRYVVELKWVGRSVKHTCTLSDEKLKLAVGKKWKCSSVTVFGLEKVASGLEQLSDYLERPHAHKGFLVAFDCRHPDMIAKDPIDVGSYVHPDLKPWQYRVLSVPVDPRSPSVKSK